jgi:hypothetical protein
MKSSGNAGRIKIECHDPVRLVPQTAASAAAFGLGTSFPNTSRKNAVFEYCPQSPTALPRKTSIINFGLASSATNCSIDTRLAIRHGMRASDLGHPWSDLLDRTTIWQYARYAGFKTIYIDSFAPPFGLSSNMTLTERSYIDELISMNEVPHYRRDIRNAQILRGLLDRQEKMFIFVDKYGTHIPYDWMYPQEQNAFGADLSKPFNLKDTKEMVFAL